MKLKIKWKAMRKAMLGAALPFLAGAISGMVGGDWIRLAAEAYEDVRRESRVAMLEANPVLKGMYSPDDGKIAVLYLKNATATFCSFTGAPETVTF